MIARYALPVALVACLALGGMAWSSSAQVAALEVQAASLARSVAVQRQAVAQRDEAARVAAARARHWETRAGELNETIQTILTADFGECADAPIDPGLADLIDGLRQADD